MNHTGISPAPWRALLSGAVTALFLACLPVLATAQIGTPMNAEQFDSYTHGQTFTFGTGSSPYGAEEYLENRRVRWSFLDGRCQEGEWYEDSGMICFVYEDNPDPQCWSFYQTPGGIVATFEDDPAQTTLYEITRSPEPLMCLGPDVGA